MDDDLDRNKLQTLADKLADYLVEKRVILKKEYDSVTLHMTLLNRAFLSEQDLISDTASDQKNARHFDCSNIIKHFSDWDFGVLEIGEILLSKRFANVGDSYYATAAAFPFR